MNQVMLPDAWNVMNFNRPDWAKLDLHITALK